MGHTHLLLEAEMGSSHLLSAMGTASGSVLLPGNISSGGHDGHEFCG